MQSRMFCDEPDTLSLSRSTIPVILDAAVADAAVTNVSYGGNHALSPPRFFRPTS